MADANGAPENSVPVNPVPTNPVPFYSLEVDESPQVTRRGSAKESNGLKSKINLLSIALVVLAIITIILTIAGMFLSNIKSS